MTAMALPAVASVDPSLSDTAREDTDAPAAVDKLSLAQWRQLARLCRQVERDDPAWRNLLGPHARTAVKALRRARVAWRDHRRDATALREPASTAAGTSARVRTPPLKALRAAATAAAGLERQLQARPASFHAPAPTAIGPGLLLQLPQFKDWLQQAFVRESAVPPDAPPEHAVARAREVLLQQCLSLSGVDDSFQRRRHLVQLLHDHGYRDPLLRLVRRSGKGWLPKDWADSWEALTGIDDDRRAADALEAALGTLAPALDRWRASLQPAAALATPAAPGADGSASRRAAGADEPASSRATVAAFQALPLVLRASGLPPWLRWAAAAGAVLAVGLGLVGHLTRSNGATDARWAVYHDADGATMAIDPDSIRREGRQLTYRVGMVWRRDGNSAVVVFTADCLSRKRRIETVQHYRGLRYETATRYEVRGTPAGEWSATGVDGALLRAACTQA